MRLPSHPGRKAAVAALCAGILIFWVAMELPCPIRHLTGIPCPGCGMGRAWLAALRLDFGQAFAYHPMFWAVPLVALFALYDFRLLPGRRSNGLVLALLALGTAVCYFIRLAAFFHGNLAI